MYLFEHLLVRLGKSGYAEAFVLKGGNWRAHLRARYGKIDAPVKIDITTEDEIVPGRIEYRYPLMFEEGSVRVLSYPLETVLAEKLETVVSRGIANTRGRDYYDIHTLLRLKAGEINRDSLHEAVVATASRRGSLGTMGAMRKATRRGGGEAGRVQIHRALLQQAEDALIDRL